MRRSLNLSVVVLIMLVGCGGGGEGGEEGKRGSCGPPPASQGSVATKLPDNFPTPEGVTYTSAQAAGPSKIVEAYTGEDLDAAFESYKEDFGSAGYDVTDSEKEEDDAEVNFSGGNSTGQVKMVESCQGRTDLTITIRPA